MKKLLVGFCIYEHPLNWICYFIEILYLENKIEKEKFMAEQKSIFGKNFVVFNQSKQKRKNTRVRMDIPCQIYSPVYSTPIKGTLIELGLGGIKFQSGALHYTDDRVEVEFPLFKKIVTLSGIILRISGKNAVLKLDTTPEETKEVIQDFIYRYYRSNIEDNKPKNFIKTE